MLKDKNFLLLVQTDIDNECGCSSHSAVAASVAKRSGVSYCTLFFCTLGSTTEEYIRYTVAAPNPSVMNAATAEL